MNTYIAKLNLRAMAFRRRIQNRVLLRGGVALALFVLAAAPAEAASFAGTQTGPTEWTYTLTYDPLDNYAVCPAPGNVATITLSGLVGVVAATPPTSTDFDPPGGYLDTINLAWIPQVSGGGTVVTWTHLGPGTGNFSVPKHVYGFKVFTATPAVNGAVNVASDGFSFDVSVIGPCPVQPKDDRDFTGTTDGPVGLVGIRVVPIDVKPGSFPNSINMLSQGTIPVAILSTASFQAPTEVDRSSLTFGRTGNEQSLAFCTGAEDVNNDGLLDLVCHFFTRSTGFQPGDSQGILKGQTVIATPILGTDSVRIVK